MTYQRARRQIRVMIIDDVLSMRELLEEQLKEAGYQTHTQSSATEAIQTLSTSEELPDLIIVDVRMPGMSGLDFCQHVSSTYPTIRTIVMTAFGSMDRAIEAMRAGAFDFLPKPFHFDVLEMTIERAMEHVGLHAQVKKLKKQKEMDNTIIGEGPEIAALKTKIDRMARVELPVFISGESGVGKELVALAIHQHSPRSHRPYVTVNCAALPTQLLESELFGHVKGAFTGAAKARQGLFRKADGGTLFLDEIGDMPQALQPKLLRVLQEQRIRPVGGDQELKVDVRIISATHKPLAEHAAQSTFRRDLLFRLNVLNVEVPPLRERRSDIVLLAQFFLRKAAKQYPHVVARTFSEEAIALMYSYSWPGNVRELQNNILAASAMCQSECIGPEFFPAYQMQHLSNAPTATVTNTDTDTQTLDDVINTHIIRVLKHADGNKALAARLLGIDRKTLYARLEKIDLTSNRDASNN